MTVYRIDAADPENPVVHLNRKARLSRQYFRFVRRGAVRIRAATSHTAFDPLAFVNVGGEYVVVVKASAGGTMSISGLPPAVYAVCYSTPAAFNVRLPNQTIADGEAIKVAIRGTG